jgi:3-(methylthio)propanoyl-CoA dehydrogenase
MSDFVTPLKDMRFALNHVANLEEISKLNGYQHADPETVESLLEEAARFFEEVIAPLNRPGDEEGSNLDPEGQVRTPDGFKDAYDKYVEAGWAAAQAPAEWGGGGLPYTVGSGHRRDVQDGQPGLLAMPACSPTEPSRPSNATAPTR